MAVIEDAFATMAKNIVTQTGKDVASWVKLARRVGYTRHSEIVKWLKSSYGLSHAYANFLALRTIGSGHIVQSGSDLLTAQYRGTRATMKPIYDRIIAVVEKFGPDLEIAPRKENVSLRRHQQFALLQPTAKRLDVGLVLPRVRPAGRLESAERFNAMVTHRVRVCSVHEVDDELTRWLKEAYEAN